MPKAVHPPVYPVEGQIVSGNKPAVGVQVILHQQTDSGPTNPKLFPNGITDDQGKYHLTTFQSQDGAPEGNWIITLTWPDPGIKPEVRVTILSEGESLPDRFRGRLANPSTSQWKLTIIEGENNAPLIQLP